MIKKAIKLWRMYEGWVLLHHPDVWQTHLHRMAPGAVAAILLLSIVSLVIQSDAWVPAIEQVVYPLIFTSLVLVFLWSWSQSRSMTAPWRSSPVAHLRAWLIRLSCICLILLPALALSFVLRHAVAGKFTWGELSTARDTIGVMMEQGAMTCRLKLPPILRECSDLFYNDALPEFRSSGDSTFMLRCSKMLTQRVLEDRAGDSFGARRAVVWPQEALEWQKRLKGSMRSDAIREIRLREFWQDRRPADLRSPGDFRRKIKERASKRLGVEIDQAAITEWLGDRPQRNREELKNAEKEVADMQARLRAAVFAEEQAQSTAWAVVVDDEMQSALNRMNRFEETARAARRVGVSDLGVSVRHVHSSQRQVDFAEKALFVLSKLGPLNTPDVGPMREMIHRINDAEVLCGAQSDGLNFLLLGSTKHALAGLEKIERYGYGPICPPRYIRFPLFLVVCWVSVASFAARFLRRRTFLWAVFILLGAWWSLVYSRAMAFGGFGGVDFQRVFAWFIVAGSIGGCALVLMFGRPLVRVGSFFVGVAGLISCLLMPLLPVSVLWLYGQWSWSVGSDAESGLLVGMFSGFMFRADPWLDPIEWCSYLSGFMLLVFAVCFWGPIFIRIYTLPHGR